MNEEANLTKTEGSLDESIQENDLETLIKKAETKESRESNGEIQEIDDTSKKEKLEALKKEIEREKQGYQAVYDRDSEAWKRVEDYFGSNIKPADLEKDPDVIFYEGRVEKAKQNYEKTLSGDIGEKKEDNKKNITEPNLGEGAIEEKKKESAGAVSNEEKIEKNDEEDKHSGEKSPEIIELLESAKNDTERMVAIAESISAGNFELWTYIRNHKSLENIFNDNEVPDAVKDNINRLPEIIAKEKGTEVFSIDQNKSIKDYLGKLVDLWNQGK